MTKEEGEKFAAKHEFTFFETSALNGQDVGEVFRTLATRILKKIESREINPDNELNYGLRRGKKGSSAKKDSPVNIMKPSISTPEKK